MAKDFNVANKDEALAASKRVTAVLEDAVNQCRQFIQAADECDGIAGLVEFKTQISQIATELEKILTTSQDCEKFVKSWCAKLEEADDILAKSSLQG